MSSQAETHRAITTVWKVEQPRLIAGLTRMVRDISLAEELAQDALVSALKSWPDAGVPRNPGAWLMQTAKRRAIDMFRHNKMAATKLNEVGYVLETDRPDGVEALHEAMDDEVGDDLLRLIFTSCHPILPPESRVALTLRLIGGLSTEEIARAFLAAEPTIGQRIVRAKKTIAEAGIPYEVPTGPERAERLASVLGVLYLIFNEGYSATAGEDLMRPQLCSEAIRLGRILAQLTPDEAEVHALVGLMEIQSSRTAARTDSKGQPILLLDQDRSRWDQLLIRRGLAALDRAVQLGGASGPYALQAAIAACHARARMAGDTDWARIAALYAVLAEVTPSPVIELNRAVAISMAEGPAAALALIDTIKDDPALKSYHLLYGVRGDMLSKLGRHTEAMLEFRRAAELTRNERERSYLLGRAEAG
ncbi:RNA polymerase subunit sigma-24 [Devosia epidermidihirudinis]|uniref:RNA polymerase subunit sigma-24 n=1 Tax=Devosia epidermidihirudinis TaxID=1293439 RepID=A0A0F5QIW4_9HYPH|nr:RNA polymerase sigma factor [Devosia epidermidihirudinis]KKC40905.1 RNA polymerase subunit sigma-24 [Devosia epidermidihirudinis]